MATLSIYTATIGQLETGVSAAVKRLLSFVKKEYNAARTLNQLSALSNAELRDIGIFRSDIKNVAYGKYK